MRQIAKWLNNLFGNKFYNVRESVLFLLYDVECDTFIFTNSSFAVAIHESPLYVCSKLEAKSLHELYAYVHTYEESHEMRCDPDRALMFIDQYGGEASEFRWVRVEVRERTFLYGNILRLELEVDWTVTETFG